MRKDGKSQYQIKKEKLQKIKLIIDHNRWNWKYLKAAEIEEERKYWASKIKMPGDMINEIWEIVKDEKDNN